MAPSSLLPVELRRVNHAASTNAAEFTVSGAHALLRNARTPAFARAMPANPQRANAYNARAMAMDSSTPFDRISERVERLLVRHEQIERTNALLKEQVVALTQERDSLRSRLQAARARVDALIERLPTSPTAEDAP